MPFEKHDLVSASELREFIFCELAWRLSKDGYRVSQAAQMNRAAGTAFHADRAARAAQGDDAGMPKWILFVAAIGVLLVLLYLFGVGR